MLFNDRGRTSRGIAAIAPRAGWLADMSKHVQWDLNLFQVRKPREAEHIPGAERCRDVTVQPAGYVRVRVDVGFEDPKGSHLL
jgi:hypothetical protein